eukprot:MONOS_12857.1-p1 / transcript=MONOS_12857.1 / gene=MONOS_12857 / organism=Monocercomonoides_exilis_PA203 / gene_product=unspecified product / transcript_product=unspecified product / location=Mono_scaffold00743:6467-13285(-) / protein_length=2272 / sequence_SO=supercontig / SO=protein_coding / is_pseudo=false
MDVHITLNSGWNSLTIDNFTECYSLSEGTRVVRCITESTYKCETSMPLYWLPDFHDDFRIRANFYEGVDNNGCGFAPLCQTLKHSLTRLTTNTNAIVQAGSCVFCEETIEVGSELASIAGISREETIIRSLEGNSVFTVNTGTLDINDCHLKHMDGVNGTSNCFLVMSGNGKTTVKKCDVSCVDEQNEVHSSAFKVNTGYALLEEVRMFEMKFSSCCTISFEQEAETCVLEIISTNSSKLTRTNGDGSIAKGRLSSGGKIIVSNCMLEESVCEDGNGGALSIYVEDDGKVEVNGTEYTKFSKCRACKAQNGQSRESGYGGGVYVYFSDSSHLISLTNVSFEECYAEAGSDIFINGNVLNEIVSNDTFNFSLDMNNLSALSGMERSAGSDIIFSLVYFLRQWSGSAHVNGSEGTDFSGCGYIDCPCKTIEAAALRFHDQKRIIVLGSGFIIDHETQLKGYEYMIGDENLPVSISANGISQKQSDELLLASISTSMCGISFVLPSSLNHRSSLIRSSFDLSNPSTLSLSKCTFLLSAQEAVSHVLPYSLLSATGGNLIMKTVSMSSLAFENCPAFVASMLTVNISEINLDNISTTSTNGIVSVTNANQFSLANSLFSSPNPHFYLLMAFDNQCTISFENCSFANILRENQNGGAIELEIGEGKGIEVKNCSFENCGCIGAGSRGGAVNGHFAGGVRVFWQNCSVCKSFVSEEDGSGGGMDLTIESNVAELTMKEIIFQMNTASRGADICLTCPEPEKIVKRELWEGTPRSIEKKERMWMVDITIARSREVSLVYYLEKPTEGSVYVGGTGIDFECCGWEAVQCLSIECGYKQMGVGMERMVIEAESALSNTVAVIGKTVELLGKEEKGSRIVVSKHGQLKIGEENESGKLNVESVEFCGCDEPECKQSLITIEKGNVRARSCIFGRKLGAEQKYWNQWLASVLCGELVLESGWIGGIVFDRSKGLFEVNEKGKIEISNLNIVWINACCTGLVAFEEGATVEMIGCTMERISMENGSVLTLKTSNLRKVKNGESVVKVEGCDVREIEERNEDEDLSPCLFNNINNINEVIETSGVNLLVNCSNISRCETQSSLKGGGLYVECCEGSSMRIECTTMMMCKALRGKGGGVYVNNIGEGAAGFKFLDDIFILNDAQRGRDIFVECWSFETQIRKELFDFEIAEATYNTKNAIYGKDHQMEEGEDDVNIIDLILGFYSDLIFVSGDSPGGTNSKMCGSSTMPCLSVNSGLTHLEKSFDSRVVVSGSSWIDEECNLEDLVLKSMTKVLSIISINCDINRTREWLVDCKGNVEVERQQFEFDSTFSSDHDVLFLFHHGEAALRLCQFKSVRRSDDTENKINPSTYGLIPFSLILIESSTGIIESCDLEEVQCKSKCISCTGFGRVCIRDFTCKDVILDYSFLEDKDGNLIEVCRLYVTSVLCLNSLFAFEGKKANKNITLERIDCNNVKMNRGSIISFGEREQEEVSERLDWLTVEHCLFTNISSEGNESSVFDMNGKGKDTKILNCSCIGCCSSKNRGEVFSFSGRFHLLLDLCVLDGNWRKSENCISNANFSRKEHFLNKYLSEIVDKNFILQKRVVAKSVESEICSWNSSLVEVNRCSAEVKRSRFSNSPVGALSVSSGDVLIEDGEFIGNSPGIPNYNSICRNILCTGGARLNILDSIGNGTESENESLWILNEGCNLSGIGSGMHSPFFVPSLNSVRAVKSENDVQLLFNGSLLLPCNLSFEITRKEEETKTERYYFDDDDFINENEMKHVIHCSTNIFACGEKELEIKILFGNADAPSSTKSVTLKNESESEVKGDGKIVEGEAKTSSLWIVIVIILVVLLAVLIISIVVTIRWRKQKKRTEELEEIVNDTVKKDSKAFEMVTMEMSPEEQWRRAERGAEKKNEERTKKRVYEKTLGHSDSSEHLLSESGSTEYILGRDSDKIPERMLEKIDEKEEEEEVRKRTPSPSISSTSTTDTDSTFVRGEDLFPTTSSMSNLVDAMACSSPHEKLIVDLRDSLFMLLHGRNKTKEMAIGSLKEREQTAAQILFWVANLALHSFDEMENPLQSLLNLSPHIVLFSEHMVICVVMHSDFSSDDSDSSSISSSTVATSISDDDDDDSLPSSAFEDEDEFQKECMRWKAPELLINKKLGATKESVVFSIGMMLWECLTLNIPFGEYEAEMAGQKIQRGETPNLDGINASSPFFGQLISASISSHSSQRPSLTDMKRYLIGHFPPGAAILTVSDAIDLQYASNGNEEGGSSCIGNGSESVENILS